MPERKHNMFAIKLIGLAVSIVSVVLGIITIDWSSTVKFGHSVVFLYEHVEEIDHVLDDYHQILGMQVEIDKAHRELDSLKRVLFETKSRDSLIHVIELLNGGKYPYDSIWHLGPSGYRYETTIEKHFNEEHEN